MLIRNLHNIIILRPFVNLYYKFKLGTSFFNDGISPILDDMIRKLLESDIESIDRGYCTSLVKFTNGDKFDIWDSNKYFAWLSRGTIQCGNVVYAYDGGRPSPRTMYKFLQKTIDFKKDMTGIYGSDYKGKPLKGVKDESLSYLKLRAPGLFTELFDEASRYS